MYLVLITGSLILNSRGYLSTYLALDMIARSVCFTDVTLRYGQFVHNGQFFELPSVRMDPIFLSITLFYTSPDSLKFPDKKIHRDPGGPSLAQSTQRPRSCSLKTCIGTLQTDSRATLEL